ncbi:PhoX family protein [Isoalcanivorax beigongshangi]|uniref:PhoX family phosphatase n=1 Tax=Isoalcanivorax beigongshangi TaxID=3238810 RepID=A0ABV4AJL9_9GAMM
MKTRPIKPMPQQEQGNNPPEPSSNQAGNRHFDEVLAANLSRRTLLQGTLGASAVAFLGGTLAACGSDSGSDRPVIPGVRTLGFKSIATGRDDAVMVPEGYTATAFLPWGTPILGAFPDYRDDGLNTGDEQAEQMGSNHDGIIFFPIDGKSDHGLLVMNHEYVDQKVLHAHGADQSGAPRPADDVKKEMNAHGISVVEIQKSANGGWELVAGGYNRRVTAITEMKISGPMRGTDAMKTAFDPSGQRTRGTLNNCGSGYTPWGTYLISEENWAGYFHADKALLDKKTPGYNRYNITGWQNYHWYAADQQDDLYQRFAPDESGASASEDFRNEPHCFGWLVEVDPFDPNYVPRKRTAMGRFSHEGVIPAPVKVGKPMAFYSGDDSTNEYIYKFVTKAVWAENMEGGDVLDEGTLYVARFNDDGSGDWLPLDFDHPLFKAAMDNEAERPPTSDRPRLVFTSQADVLLNTRGAADILGATPMDRPEWGAVNPNSGEVYFTLTNNSPRTVSNAANPRVLNRTGHIIRWNEEAGEPAATKFYWNIFVFAGHTEGHLAGFLPRSGKRLTDENVFASPDGLLYDDNGILWIQTDMSGDQQAGKGPDGDFGNNQMLAAVPETGEIKRFMVGPVDCEVTGVCMTPDHKTMFINIQHPGDRSQPGQFTSHWPTGGNARPRSATVVITKDDGGVIGL